MIFLTYHRVADDLIGEENFYTVTPLQFSEHLGEVERRRLAHGDIDALVDNRSRLGEVFWCFDDGTEDHFKVVAPLLEARGWRGIFFVPTDKLDRPGRLRTEDLRHLAEAGHEIGCHSHEHRRLDAMSNEEIAGQLSHSCAILEKCVGARPRLLAPPGGYTSRAVRAIAVDQGLHVIRTMKWGLNRLVDLTALETIPLNRGVTGTRLGRILDGRGLAWLRALYLGKQIVKSLLPKRLYERARGRLSAS